ncbi:hypothetical protein BJV82DRAFT_601406 [Fennellomyces sp. T-0311]|nr:hypothetical protein BJV82DRAFT_601406 [Fennellomyces sp. T-0311]
MKLLLTCILATTCLQVYGIPTVTTSSYNQSIIPISSNFLVMPTDGLSADDEVRAARVAETHHPTTIDDDHREPKFPDDEITNKEESQEQQLNKNIIAGIVGASGAGLVAIVAVGIFVWHSQKRSSTKDVGYNEPKSPILFPPTTEPAIANSSSYFDEWDQRQQEIRQSVDKFPSSTYSAIYRATTNDSGDRSRVNGPSHLREVTWSSDTGSSESMSIRDLSSFAENSTINNEPTRPPASFQSVTQSDYAHSVASSERIRILDKDERHTLSLVNRKLLHYPAVSRLNTASSSKKTTDDNASECSLQRLFQLPDTELSNEEQPPMLPTSHRFTSPFDLPASKFIPLANCPYTLVTRQSILDDPQKRQGLHEIP